MLELLDQYYNHLRNYGMSTDRETVGMVTLMLIDEYYNEIVDCMPELKDVLDRTISGILGSSCMFRTMHDDC